MPDPRRLACCITDLDAGGAERALVQIVTRFPSLGWSPHVVCLSGPGALVAPLKAAGIPVECLGAESARALGVVSRLANVLRDWRPDVLQTFMFHANLAGRWAARKAGVPVVVCGLRVAERDAPWRMRLDRWTQRLVTHNIAVSQGVADFAIKEVGLPADKVSVIPNGVDYEHFASAPRADLSPWGIPLHARVVTFIGRLHPQKAPELLIEAALPRLRTDETLHLLLVGEGPLRSSLEAAAAASGVGDRIHFAGRVPDVAGVLRASTVCVLPSRWEGMPNVVLEAMAAGCPVIASDVEGSRELILPDRTGWLFPRDSAEALRCSLEECLDHPQLASRFSIESQSIAQKEFTWQKIAQSYATCYARLASANGGC